MTETGQAAVLLVLGALTVLSVLIRKESSRLHIPDLAGYIILGIGLSWLNSLTGFITEPFEHNIGFLAQLGVAAILFRVGLESDLNKLVRQLRKASIIWLPNIFLAASAVFLVVYFWPGYGLVPALFAGIASSATSVGVSVAVWEQAGRLNTPQGALLLDVAELDDVAAIILLSILFSIVPVLKGTGDASSPWVTAFSHIGIQILKLGAFIAACYLFSRRLEKPLTAWFGKLNPRHGPLLFAAGAAFLIAASAELIGFSVAIGAFFAGLAFSRDPSKQEIDRSFSVIFAVFGPFFFLAIGMEFKIEAIGNALVLGLALFAAASVGKLLGAGIPAALLSSRRDGALIGMSMIPRAEIFLIVMLFGLDLGSWAVPETLYVAAVFVSLATCILGPIGVQYMLSRHPPGEEAT